MKVSELIKLLRTDFSPSQEIYFGIHTPSGRIWLCSDFDVGTIDGKEVIGPIVEHDTLGFLVQDVITHLAEQGK